MKVLFAVSSENISEAIIKQYQKQYREIISYKNVYYFNAILKELQKDKSYDRIIISEDLEPFANNNYDSIDKFIFEKLDSISDEALDSNGQDTSIILICTDRRTKASNILVKLFGIGIYNALLGKDRSIEEVCNLINKPRTKKEAKAYYKIDSDDVNYQSEDSSEVNELELQNILAHYKRLGKNTDRYIDSFNNIASQYNDAQLKVIINCLPIGVKAVLEAESPKYQELMTFSNDGTGKKKAKSSDLRQPKVKQKEPDAIKVDMIETKSNKAKMDKPVVIPGVISTSKVKRKQDESEATSRFSAKMKKSVKFMEDDDDDDEFEDVRSSKINARPKAIEDYDEEDDDDEFEEIRPTRIKQNAKKVREEIDFDEDEFEDILPTKSKKTIDAFDIDDEEDEDEIDEVVVPKVKKGRGRPRKNPEQKVEVKPKGKRGRPRKNVIEEEESDFLPGFENYDDEEENDSVLLPGMDFDDEDEDDDIPARNVRKPSREIDEDDDDEDYDEIDESATLPGIDFEDDDEDDYDDEDEDDDEIEAPISRTKRVAPKFEDEDDEDEEYDDEDEDDELIFNKNSANTNRNPKTISNFEDEEDDEDEPINQIESVKQRVDYSMSSLNSVLTKDKKIITFVGTTKNGTSFVVNNLASLFSSIGVKTAILDMTKNRNSYYIYTKNEEQLRKIAYNSIEKLQNGFAEGIKAEKNLTVYTALPNDNKDYSNSEAILSTLAQNYSLILIDCDFDTDVSYFANCQEMYLVQSMDILTIQPLTAFLRELKTKGVLEEEKIRVIINKQLRVRSLSSKTIIGGMSFYNDPAMSFMTELFNKDNVKACEIPFEDDVYSKYLETLVNCNISVSKYSKKFQNSLKNLGKMVYPLLSKTYTPSTPDYSRSNFSKNMNNTLNQMKNKY